MDIKIRGADFSAAAAGVVTATVKGFPAPDLAALYLFNGLAAATPVSGEIADESGQGNDASRVTVESTPDPLSAVPTAQGYGLQITDTDGLVLNTGVNWPASGCVVAALKNTVGDGVVQFPTWCKPSGAHFPDQKDGSYVGHGIPSPKVWINSVNSLHRQHVAFSTTDDPIPSPGAREAAGDPLGTNNWNVTCWSWDNVLGRVRLQTVLGGDTGWISAAALVDFWDTYAASKLYVGLWPHGESGDPCTGQTGGFAIYDALPDDQTRQWAMDAMARTMIARGYDISGFGD